ncbi:MAG: aromatic acid exporter family protein [Alkalibacterium sp.]|nr:aromatic acid exporter family protein [Alkalibacterium sp.]
MNIKFKMIKIVLATSIAIVIAKAVGVIYPFSAGTIAILSVLDTKKESIATALKRLGSTLMAFTIASIIFYFLGFSVWTFSLFLMVYVPAAYKLNFQSVIASTTVLVSHFITAESIALSWQINGFLLMIIGATTAIVFNLWMPSYEKDINENIRSIEEELRQLLRLFYTYLMGDTVYRELKVKAHQLSDLLEDTKKIALLDYQNRLVNNNDYYINYIEMRERQLDLLEMDIDNITAIKLKTEQNIVLAELFDDISKQLHEKNPVLSHLDHISSLYGHYRRSDLPKTREEFESRAVLFQILRNMEKFIEIKREFFMIYRD